MYLGLQISVQNPFIMDMLCRSTHLSKPPQDLETKKKQIFINQN